MCIRDRNTPFRTKFDGDLDELEGTLGIGCISDNEPQPLLIQSHLGSFAITTVGKINNEAELVASAYENGHIHFMEMSHGRINATELVAALINQKSTLVEGLLYACLLYTSTPVIIPLQLRHPVLRVLAQGQTPGNVKYGLGVAFLI